MFSHYHIQKKLNSKQNVVPCIIWLQFFTTPLTHCPPTRDGVTRPGLYLWVHLYDLLWPIRFQLIWHKQLLARGLHTRTCPPHNSSITMRTCPCYPIERCEIHGCSSDFQLTSADQPAEPQQTSEADQDKQTQRFTLVCLQDFICYFVLQQRLTDILISCLTWFRRWFISSQASYR